MSELTNEQNFNVTKYALDSCIFNLENGLSMVKQMSNAATSSEQLEQTKVYLEAIVNTAQSNLNKVTIATIEQPHIK